MSLRRSSLVFAAALAIIGAGVAIALIVLATNLHRAAHAIAIEVESLRIGEELELGLMSLHEQTEPIARAATEQLIRSDLAQADGYMSSGQEQEILATLTRQVDQYLAALDRAAASD